MAHTTRLPSARLVSCVLAGALSLSACGPTTEVGCLRDTDCKGDRLCVAGSCVPPDFQADLGLATIADLSPTEPAVPHDLADPDAAESPGEESPLEDDGCLDCGGGPLPFGALIGTYRGVPAYSNGDTTGCHACADGKALGLACGARCTPTVASTPETPYGIAYQCVELARRFYATVYSDQQVARSRGNAVTYVQQLPAFGFTCARNGDAVSPQPDDLLVFEGGAFGHIAVIATVAADHVDVFQQNATRNALDARFRIPMDVRGGRYTLGTPPSPLSRLTPAVWCHRPGNDWRRCDANLPCPDGYSCFGGTCRALDPCAGVACSGHGACGGGACNCNPGYSGADCSSCAAGYVGYPSCVRDACANVSCSGHGSCVGGACACNAGYAGANCASCAAGHVGYPNCVRDACAGNLCGGRGMCVGGACVCNPGYAGPDCSSCAAGFSRCGGSCVPSACSANDARCRNGATEICDAAGCGWSPGKACECGCDANGAACAPCSTFWFDGDGDGHGDLGQGSRRLAGPSGSWRALDDRDCDDADAAVAPGALEVYDARDNDCDGSADEDGLLVLRAWHREWGVEDWEHRYSIAQPAGFRDDGWTVGIYPSDLCASRYAPPGCRYVNGGRTVEVRPGVQLSALGECSGRFGLTGQGSHISLYLPEDSGEYQDYAVLQAAKNPFITCRRVGYVMTPASAAARSFPGPRGHYRLRACFCAGGLHDNAWAPTSSLPGHPGYATLVQGEGPDWYAPSP